MKIGDKVKLNETYFKEGKTNFGRHLKSFKIATIIDIIKVSDKKDDCVAILDSKSITNIHFKFLEKE